MIIFLELIFNIRKISINNKIITFEEITKEKTKLLGDFIDINEHLTTKEFLVLKDNFINTLYFIRDIRNSICHAETLQIFWIKKRLMLIYEYINKSKNKKIKKIEIRKNDWNQIIIDGFLLNYRISTKIVYVKNRHFINIEEVMKKCF